MTTLSEIEKLAIKYCPVIYFTKDEKYMPASFEYLLKNFPIIDKNNNVIPAGEVKENGKCVWSQGNQDPKTSKKYLLNFGLNTGGDGYPGKASISNKLYGDPSNPKRYVHVYTLGEIKNESTGTTFIDLVYGVYFCWNGTVDNHAFDVEEIILRFQKQNNKFSTNQFKPIYNDYNTFGGKCNENSCGKYFLSRVFLSAHGNGMLYPTRFPNVEGNITDIEFYKDQKLGQTCRPIIYSAVKSHAMYPTTGIQKRLFGFGNDFTAKDILWNPTFISLWSPAFILDKNTNSCDSTTAIKPGIPVELDVEKEIKLPKPDDSLWFSLFDGVCGNILNNQTTIPFKPNLLNIVSSGDFYYKFQKGGADNMINSEISNSLQRKLVIICLFVTLISMVYALFFTYRRNSRFQIFIPLVTLIGTLTISIGSLIMFAGGGVAPSIFGQIISNKKYREYILFTLVVILSVFYIILPIIFNKHLLFNRHLLKKY